MSDNDTHDTPNVNPAPPSAPQQQQAPAPDGRIAKAVQAVKAARSSEAPPSAHKSHDAPTANAKPDDAPQADVAPREADPKPDDRAARRLAEIARRDRELKQREDALKEKQGLIDWATSVKQRKESDPLAVLEEELGLTYSQLTDLYASKPVADPVALEALATAKEVKESIERDKREAQQALVRQGEADFRRMVKEGVDGGGDAFELVRLKDAYEDVFVLIRDHVKSTGEVLPLEKAASLVEEELLAEEERVVGTSKKLRAKFSAEPIANDRPRGGDARRPRGRAPDEGRAGDAAATGRDVTLTNASASANPNAGARTAGAKGDRLGRALDAMRRVKASQG